MHSDVLTRELDGYFREELPRTVAWGCQSFDDLVDARRPSLVVYGAGSLGRKTAAGLKALGRPPLALADNNQALWGRQVEGIPVISPAEIARRFGGEVLVVMAVWSPGPERRLSVIRAQLASLGCVRTIPFTVLFWKHPSTYLPHDRLDLPQHIQEAEMPIRRVFSLLQDDESRQEYLNQLRWIASSDFGALAGRNIRETYLPDEILRLSSEEALVDCGAFDGDTIRAFLDHRANAFQRIFAFEPDPANYLRLKSYVAGLPCAIADRIRVYGSAVSDRREVLRFEASGSVSSRISGTGALEVPCEAIDDQLAGQRVSYIKMDIEGAEPKALQGARRTIAKHAPSLAICVYHRQEHLWELPLQMQAFRPDYRLFLRRYGDEFGDVVCYAVAPHQQAVSCAGAS
jgi:FkbM family methyltransferase